jgi:sugar/nucleoside kinase (ribokinase family)
MIDVAGVGASSVDLVYTLPAYPAPEGPLSKLPIQSHFIACGGQTATAMAGCAALGLRAAFLGATGNDAHGARLRDELARRGVDITHTRTLDGPQPYAVILLAEGHGERIVLWRREAAKAGGELSASAIQGARLVHVDDVDEEDAIAAATLARKAGRLVTTDIDRVTGSTRALIGLATHPILAEHVPAALTGEADLSRALRRLRDLGTGPLIVTRGASGAMALDGDTLIESAGFQVEAVDTTGAGDVFRAGFIAATLEQQPLRDALRYANGAAAVSCTRRGAFDSVPARDEIGNLLRKP